MENIFKICGFNGYLIKTKRIKKDGYKPSLKKGNFSKSKSFIF